ncbi:guanyl-specific ribonuclease Pb1 [Kalaharituber pfeilii]|nr:guanyl-specific ribonuclease Pb1 [Kalaharituber pfeilii]
MKFSSVCLVVTTIFASLAVAQTVSGVTAAQCNGYYISASAIQAAANTALAHLNAGTDVGSNNYPHRYNNYEGFAFNSGCNAPYYEFPVFRNYIYTGGDPGLDRVVVGSWDGTNARYCDAITHSGASGNSFRLCSNA